MNRTDRKIVVIGAGAAGLATAYYLKRHGYMDVTVLEKLGRVGGLCRTITQDYKSFDLGANYITPAFREVLKLAREHGARMYGERSGIAVELPEDGSDPIWRDVWTVVKGDLSTWAFLRKCANYSWLRFKLNSILNHPGFAGVSKHPDLCVSFIDWLKKNNLTQLERLFIAPITMMGYGFIQCPDEHDALRADKEIPAPHALKYMSVLTFLNAVAKFSPLFNWVPWPKRFVLGYQRLWEVVSSRLNVQKNINVKSIHRSGKDRKIAVTFTRLQQIDNLTCESQPTTIEYDDLIIACPLQAEVVSPFLKDMTDDEKDLLGHVVTYSYQMTSCHVVDFEIKAPFTATYPLTRVGTPWVATRQFADSTLTQFYSRVAVNSVNYPERLRARKQDEVDSAIADQQEATNQTRCTIEPMPVRKFRQGHLEDSIDPEVRKFVERVGGKIVEDAWRTFDQWPYFQHFRVEEIRAGFYDRFEELQGKNNTYYVGGLMNFELVNTIMLYAKHVVQTHFPRR